MVADTTRSVPVTFANTGIVLKSAADEIPLTAYRQLANVVTDRENTVSVRRGFDKLNDGLPSPPYSLSFLKDNNGRQWRYAIAASVPAQPNLGGQLYVAPVDNPNDATVWPLASENKFLPVPGGGVLQNGLTGIDKRAFFATYTLIAQTNHPYLFLADGEKFLCHPGGMAPARRIGIPKPTAPLVVTLEPASSPVVVEDFQDVTAWTLEDAIDTSKAQVDPGKVGKAIRVVVTGDKKSGGIKKALGSVNLGENNDETIEIWIKFDTALSARNCSEVILSFNLSSTPGDVSFTTRFEKAFVPNDLEAASQPGAAGRTVPYPDTRTAARNRNSDARTQRLTPLKPDDQEFDTGQTSQLRPGAGVWNRQRIPKNQFTRVGESAITRPDLSWNTITAIRLEVRTVDAASGAKTCGVEFDDCSYRSTGKLFGIDYAWTFTYYDSRTDTESEPAPFADVPYPGANFDQYRLAFPPNPGNTPPLADPDFIRIYRVGGTANLAQLVQAIPYLPMTTPPPFIDNVPDKSLLFVLELDNQLPPDKVGGVELYDDRLFTWGGEINGVPEPPNRLRYSKKVRVQHFPANNYVYVGTGSEQIIRAFEHDGELFVFTISRVYRMLGSDGNYRPVTTGINQGLKSPFAICRGTRSVYAQAYDGIYEFPAGRKISEPVNQIFSNENVNGIEPIWPGRERETVMAFWNSKLYFSYPGAFAPNGSYLYKNSYGLDTAGDISNDRTLVWDAIYERWHWYRYGAQYLMVEPENNILVGANVLDVFFDDRNAGNQDGLRYGNPLRQAGEWPMRLEFGFTDRLYDIVGSDFIPVPVGIDWIVDTREYDLGAPDQEKRFIDFVFDAETFGSLVSARVAFDEGSLDPIGNIVTCMRERTILPVDVNEGEGRLAVRARLRLSGRTQVDATASTRLYKVVHRILIEPIRHKAFVTDWSDYGNPAPKFFRELWVELKTFGFPLRSIEVHVDGGLAQVIEAGTKSSERTRFFYGLRPDLLGTLARIKVIPGPDNEVILYDHGFQSIPQPPQISTIQTDWSDQNYPYEKLWKHVQLDIDTGGKWIPFEFWLDGKVVETFRLLSDGRARKLHSLERNLIGKLGRLTVNQDFVNSCDCLPGGLKLFGVVFAVDRLPPDVTIADSYEQILSYDRFKLVRRLWLALENEADTTLELYVDNILRTTKIIAPNDLLSGYLKVRVDLPPGLKGKLYRPVFTSPFPFRLHWDQSELEIKGLDAEDGWQRIKFPPPQTY